MPLIHEDLNEFLLHLEANNGKKLEELTEELKWSKKRTAKAIGQAENYGMVRGSWERLSESNQRWTRRYYIAGEGTKDYIKTLQNSSRTGT